MEQTERDHKPTEDTTEKIGAKEENASGQPRSWRRYIEETEAAEKKAEREAARARSAKVKKEKRLSHALIEKVRANAQRGTLKEKAARAFKALSRTGGACWEWICDATADGWDSVSAAVAKVRSVVDRHPVSPLLYVTLLAVVVCASTFNGSYIRAFAFNVNGQEVGVVSGQDEVDTIVGNIESRASDILGEHFNYDADISLTPVYVNPGELSDTTQMEDTLFDDVGALMTAYGLRVDGQELGYAPTKDELYNMLDEVAQPYLTVDTVSYEFVEEVEVYPIELPANTQFDTESIRTTLHQLEEEQAVYTVKKGDTFNAIAYSLDMWPNELSVLNPDVIVDKLWVDQELVIRQAVPYLSVQMVADETYEETVPSPVEYIETPDLYVGDTQVKEEGEDGLERVNAYVAYINGVEMGREVKSTETLKEATITYSYTGTTPRPVTASNGYYIWPVRGRITSNFGSRNLWGSYDFHLGLDIACPMGTGIKASDGGTVIKAGWSGSYGNLVAIQHDNGTITYYAHNSSVLVSVGQKVYQGQIIARAGMTGNASGPHCHFEVRVNGTSVNPRNYLQ